MRAEDTGCEVEIRTKGMQWDGMKAEIEKAEEEAEKMVEKIAEGGLVADAWDGLPIPEGHEGMQSEGSRFRKQANTTVVAELSRVVDFYRRELPSGEWGEWKENTADAKVEQKSARLAFRSGSRAITRWK